MIHFIFSVYDEKAKAFMPPFIAHQNGMALRQFTSAVLDEKHAFGKWPADYTLFRLGTFNDEDGMTTTNKEVMVSGVEARAAGLQGQDRETILEGMERVG